MSEPEVEYIIAESDESSNEQLISMLLVNSSMIIRSIDADTDSKRRMMEAMWQLSKVLAQRLNVDFKKASDSGREEIMLTEQTDRLDPRMAN